MAMAPAIKPYAEERYEIPTSRYPQCGQLPLRSILLAPSGGGKTVLLTNLLLDVYRDCFERIFVFSPSVDVDAAWVPVKEYCKARKMTDKDDQLFFSEYDPEALEKNITNQRRVIEHQKSAKHKKLFQICIIVDDFADDPSFSRHSKLLHSLFTRGRHSQISTIVATQKYSALAPIIRVNATELYVFRLRSTQDLSTVIEENSALVSKEVLMKLYRLATHEPHGFLFINLKKSNLDEMFMKNFHQRFLLG